MGTTDLIPGFSGATTAFILGIYERLIEFISGLAQVGLRRKTIKELDWKFFIPLLVGLLGAVFSLARLLKVLLEDYPEEMAGLFFGLTVVVVYSLLSSIKNEKIFLYLISVGVGVLFFWVLGFQSSVIENPNLLIFFLAGAVASVALILPGISGSFILLILGLYSPVINAVSDFEIPKLVLLGLGVVSGLVLLASLLNLLLKKCRAYLVAVLAGLLLGSVRVLWPWPDGVGVIDSEAGNNLIGTKFELPSLGQLWLPLLLAVVGFLIALALHLKVKNKI